MKRPLIQRRGRNRNGERGVTLALVAAAIVAILAMAALSIDVGSLYLANAEAQRAADAAALAGARWLSVSGMTGDPSNTGGQWLAACTQAKELAMGTAIQNNVGGSNLTVPEVTITVQDGTGNGCSSAGAVAFGVNPQVTVKVVRPNLPLFFAPAMRAFFSPGSSRRVTVSATATAEAYNPSDSLDFSASGLQLPVAPRCVRPWIIPNADPDSHPGHPVGSPFLNPDGSLVSPGIISPFGTGVIGEQFTLFSAACTPTGSCGPNPGYYIPADITGPYVAVPATATATPFQQASAGCDVGTVYNCGTTFGAQADLTFNPGGATGDTSIAVQALINKATGRDMFDFGVYPFQIQAGNGNPLVVNGGLVAANAIISTSNSIVSLPIRDNVAVSGANPPVSIVGYLQVFIEDVLANGNLQVRVLNVSGCGTPTGSAIGGTSPVPVRLVQ